MRKFKLDRNTSKTINNLNDIHFELNELRKEHALCNSIPILTSLNTILFVGAIFCLGPQISSAQPALIATAIGNGVISTIGFASVNLSREGIERRKQIKKLKDKRMEYIQNKNNVVVYSKKKKR